MKRFLAQHRHKILIALCAIVLFATSLILVVSAKGYVSPDETAIAVFARQFVETGEFRIPTPLNNLLGNTLYPRSVVSLQGALVPVGFLGLPALYGSLANVFGAWSIPVWTPFIAALAVGAWFAVCRRWFGQKIALLSAVLLAFHPAWWYYTARSLMPNVPFVACLIFAVFFAAVRPFSKNQVLRKKMGDKVGWLDALAVGMSFGWALWIRPSELVWIFGALAILSLLYRKHIPYKLIMVSLAGIALIGIPALFYNAQTYGSVFETGYTLESQEAELQNNTQTEVVAEDEVVMTWRDHLDLFVAPVLPFGIHPRAMVRHAFSYGGWIFWWLTVPAIIGVLFYLRSTLQEQDASRRRGKIAYMAVFAWITGWLILLYGSWSFHDNPDPTAVTLANSYARYWLPIYVLSTPFIAMAFQKMISLKLSSSLKDKALRTLTIFLFGAMLGANVNLVFFQGEDSLTATAEVLQRSEMIRQEVLHVTEKNAVIIVDRADKLFFPDRLVRYPLRDERTYALMPEILKHAPLYYYGITFPPTDIEYLNTKKLRELGLQIEHLQTFGEESLYRIMPN